MNGDGTVCAAEVHDCLVNCENAWREENCPEAEYLYCNYNPFECAECEGAWSCEDIYNISVEVIAYYDSNGDG